MNIGLKSTIEVNAGVGGPSVNDPRLRARATSDCPAPETLLIPVFLT